MSKQPNPTHNRTASKVRPVPISQMRVPPALVVQRPFIKAHGDFLASNLDLDKLGFPVINHRDGNFWILDGQHRIFALRENGFEKDNVDCEVYEGLTDAEMANIFLGRDARRAITPFAKFHVSCTAGYDRETAIRRAVETQGLKVSASHNDGCIGAVGTIAKVYDQAGGGRTGEIVLGQVLRTVRDAFGSDATSFDRSLIHGLGLVYNRYNGKTNEKHFVDALSNQKRGVRGVLARAETQRLRTGNQLAQCVAAVVVEAYNSSFGPRHGSRLPSWWKHSAESVE